MDTIKTAYYYLFYRLYKFQLSGGPFPREFSASIFIAMLETGLVFSINCYYIEFFDRTGTLRAHSLGIILPLLAVFFLNCFTFIYNKNWKNYIEKFDRWPRYKNIVGSCIVIVVVVLLLFFIQNSLSTMRQISAGRQ